MKARLMKACAAALVLAALAPGFAAFGKTPLVAKLRTRDNKAVSVNANNVGTGSSVVSGARIESPAGVDATIDLGPMGRVEMAPRTSITLTFGEGRVAVNLSSGYVVLTTHAGVVGSVTDPSDKVVKTDGVKTSSVSGRTADAAPPNKAGGGVGAGRAAAIAGGVATAAGAAAATRNRGRGRQLSPSTPGRN